MRQDLYTKSTPLTRQDLTEAAENLKPWHPDSTENELWVLQNCILLAFDDTGFEPSQLENGRSSKGKTAMVGTLDDSGDSGEEASRDARQQRSSDKSCRSDSPHLCQCCSNFPYFPATTRLDGVRSLREVDPKAAFPGEEFPICPHFLAISYCRTDQTNALSQNAQSTRSNTIRTLDGGKRRNRTPDHILDQAVCAAYVAGFKLLWIDQESYSKPDGILYDIPACRTWDFIFQVAQMTAGLLSVKVDSAEELDALGCLFNHQDGIGEKDELRRSEILYHVAHLLDRISQDRWYTCASTLKDSISAREELLLVLYRNSEELGEGSTWPPPRCRASLQKQQHPNILCLPIIDYQRTIFDLRSYLERQGNGSRLLTTDPRENWEISSPHPAFTIVQRAAELSPFVQIGTLEISITFKGSFPDRPSSRADAAAAISLLKTRRTRNDGEFLALVSDLCLYENRFTSDSIDSFKGSLRAAVLALALFNGDLSLLAPEAYSSYRALSGHDEQFPKVTSTHNLLHPFNTESSKISFPLLHRANFFRQTGMQFNDSKMFQLPAHFWNITTTLDMSLVKDRWRDTWTDMRPIVMTALPLESETTDQLILRSYRMLARLREDGVRTEMENDLMLYGHIRPQNPFWVGFQMAGCDISMRPLAQTLDSTPTFRPVLAKMIFDILEYLHQKASEDFQPLARGAANSIWHSMRVDVLPAVDGDHLDLPDEVGPELFTPNFQERATDILQFDKEHGWGGEFQQAWLLDRIMFKGELWVGTIRSEDYPSFPSTDSDSDPSSEAVNLTEAEKLWSIPHDEGRGAGNGHSLHEAEIAAKPAASPERSSEGHCVSQPGSSGEVESAARSFKEQHEINMSRLLFRQAVKVSVVAQLKRANRQRRLEESGDPNRPQDEEIPTIGRTLAFCMEAISKSPADNDKRRSTDLVSIFDVDGTCLVAVPFSSEWEVVPHPEYRSMSIGWAVELAETSPEETSDPAKYRVIGKVKGMWEIMTIPRKTYEFV